MAEVGVDISAQESNTLERYLARTLRPRRNRLRRRERGLPGLPRGERTPALVLPRPFGDHGGYESACRRFGQVRDDIRASIEEELIRATNRCSERSTPRQAGQRAVIIGLVAETAAQQFSETDLAMMRRALLAAEDAAEKGEVPVGAVVARGGEILAVAANEREATGDPTSHAELLAIRARLRRPGRLAPDGLHPLRHPGTMPHVRRRRPRRPPLAPGLRRPRPQSRLRRYPPQHPRRCPPQPHPPRSKAASSQKNAASLLRDFFRNRRHKPE